MIVQKITVSNEYDEYELEMYLNVGSMKRIERELKSEIDDSLNFYKGLKLVERGDIIPTLIFACGMLHLKGEKYPVGVNFFDDNDIDYLRYADEITDVMVKIIMDSNKPTVSEKKQKGTGRQKAQS